MVRIKWITLSTQYSGTCIVCGNSIQIGEKAQWSKGIGIRHISCGEKVDQVDELKKKSFEAIVHGNIDAARKFAQDALDTEPSEKEIFSLAQSFYDTFNFESAILLYDKVLKKNPNHTNALMNKASALRIIGKSEKAIRIYNKIIKNQPKNINARQNMAFVYIYEIGNHKKAVPIIKKIIKIDSSYSADCAAKFAACGEYELAIKLAMKVLDIKPELIDPRMKKLEWLINLMLEQKTEKDALAIINKYVKNDPKFFIHLLKFRFYRRAEKEDSARDAYFSIINEDPETDVDVVIKSNLLYEFGDHDATIKFCEDNMHRDEIVRHLQMVMAFAYRKQGDVLNATKIFSQIQVKMVENGDTSTHILRELAKIGEEQKFRADDLLPFYQEILKNDQLDKEIFVKIIHLLKKSHKTDELFSYLEDLHGIYPNNNNFTIGYANALMGKNAYEMAIYLLQPIANQYDPSSETDGDVKIALLKIAECMLKTGETKKAYETFRTLVKDDKKFKEAWDGLAIAAAELGKRSKAEKALKNAAKLEKDEFSRDVLEPERVDEILFPPTTTPKGITERTISSGKNVVQKPTFRYNPKTKIADKGIEKTFVSNMDSLLNGDGGVLQIGITDKKPTGLFNDLKLFPKKQRNEKEFEKKLRETLQQRLSDSYIGRVIRITFPKTQGVTICEIFVPKSSIAIYVKTKNKDEEFYVRENGKLVRLGPRKQTEYIQSHFFDVD